MANVDISILIVDDEFSIRDSLSHWFKSEGFNVDSAEDAFIARAKLEKGSFDIVLLDIKMPGMDGIEFNKEIQKTYKDIIVIILTAYASVDTAIQSLKDGAYDYISKPADPEELSMMIRNAVDKKRIARENIQLKHKIDQMVSEDTIVGESPQIQKVFELIHAVAQTDATVIIRGESGTGKELVARAIHFNSSRRYAPIVTVNCGAITDTLMESELFGHEKGAFTGAQYRRKGKFELAHSGTIFFDEIGNINIKMQVDLLRVLETRQFTRVGGEKPTDVDFRIISATNRDLEQAVKEGSFREDLYFRLNVFSINLPPLRERTSDIPLLANYFLEKYSASMNKKIYRITPEAMEMLQNYNWPGNIRELRNVIERAIVVATENVIRAQDLSFPFGFNVQKTFCGSLEEMEKIHIKNILERVDWNISMAARILQIDRTTLYSKINKYNLKK